jgi:hypothetical protein
MGTSKYPESPEAVLQILNATSHLLGGTSAGRKLEQ